MLPSEENRDKLSITSRDCVDSAEIRANAGFVLSMLRCICVQLPVDAVAVPKFLDSCEATAKLDDALPRVQRGIVGYKGLGGNHNNTFFRMVKQRRPCKCFCSVLESGSWVMAEEKLRGVDGAMADACRDGVPWIVLSSAMLREEKESEYIIQAAENLVGACRVLPGFLDAVARGCKFLMAMSPSEATASLQTQIPHPQADIPDLVRFCERMGGHDSHLLQMWLRMTNLMLTKNRVPKVNFLKMVAELSLKWPDCKMAVIWCAQNCPDKFAEAQYVNWICKSDVVSARSSKDFKTDMEFAQVELADRFKKISVQSRMSELHKFSALWNMVGRFILRKKHQDFEDHESLQDIFAVYDKFGDDIAGSGGLTPCPSAGNPSCAAIKVSIKAEIAERGKVKYVHGKLVDEEALLREAGLVERVYIKTTHAKLQLLKEKHRRGRGSIIL